MKRCSVIGLVDSNEEVNVLDNSSLIISIELPKDQQNTKYGIGAFVNRAQNYLVSPNIYAAELLNLSSLIYAADTRVSRKYHSQDGWTREFDIYFPVNDISMWSAQKKDIEELLSFITGDLWNIQFRSREKENLLQVANVKDDVQPVEVVSLLSGGLDSFIGAIDLLSSNTKTIFVGHYTMDGTQKYQNVIEQALKDKYSNYFIGYVKGCLAFNKRVFVSEKSTAEGSQRSRSFMFLSMAAYIASGMGKLCKLIVPENGFIALNVPLDPLRLGANSTKTVHPNFMYKMAELFQGLNLNIELENPYRFMTKGEMMLRCNDQNLLEDYAYKTLSCASQSKMRWDKGKKAKRLGGSGGNGNCGYCYPCLIRKAAFKKAGISDKTEYVAIPDLNSANIKVGKNGSVYAESKDILSIQYAGYRLENNLINPATEIHKSGTLQKVFEEWSDIASMYEHGLHEVYKIVKDIKVNRAN